MPADQLNITIVQPDIVWEDKEANLRQYERFIETAGAKKEVVVLPEMFTTGFSMRPEALAETMEGRSVSWMAEMAAKHRCILTGSLIIEEEGNYYNRLVWMQPDGKYGIYDKRHLFGYGHEDEHYTAGDKKLIVSVKGWRICPLICYDLRFPVWSRNSPEAYDVLLYVANWPERRNLAWKTLLQARAIENQSYVVGVNRVGTDGKDIAYSGDSSVFGPMGEPIWQQSQETCVETITLERETLNAVRSDLPFLKDADRFLIL
jgi:omega-amidase